MEPMTARVELEQAIAALAGDLPRMTPKDACVRLDWLRRQAVLHGFVPAAVLADGLADAIARQGWTVPLRPWLDALTMAAHCGADGAETGALLLATVGVRFAA